MTVTKYIRKRDGVTIQAFDIAKIKNAISLAWKDAIGSLDEKAISKVVAAVSSSLTDETGDVETVQDIVEVSLMRGKHFAVAKAYILYRNQRADARATRQSISPDPLAVSDYIHASKYARYKPEFHRREVYLETVSRVEEMHIQRFPQLADEIRQAFDFVREKKDLPSMRCMQFAGDAIIANHNRGYNCSYTLVDRFDAFAEAMFLLLSGCGVGYSVQFDHVESLPSIGYVNVSSIRHHVIDDSIEGWADAIKALFNGYSDGVYVEFSYHLIRPAGTPLRTSGGRAPGHVKLKITLDRIRSVLDLAQGRKLRPVECHRIMCHAADAVLSGGIRRSAMICLFSIDDIEMMNLKTGNWYSVEPWLANSNNSVVMKRDDTRKKDFKRIFHRTKQWGEPGFFFTDDYDYGCNPCGEIGFYPVLHVSKEVFWSLEDRGIHVTLSDNITGWSFCNLCEINAAKFTSLTDFMAAAKAATLIGTIQASYTKMPYLGPISEMIAERDALLGIGMTGMLDAPQIACDSQYQYIVATSIKKWNEEYASRIGIRPAARLTCIKPSGTTSLELGCVAPGHHAHHARRCIRRVTADDLEHVFQAFRAVNPHMCVRKPDGKWVIEFAVEAPPMAIVKSDLSALAFLKMVQSTQKNWVVPGTARDDDAPGLTNNVSNTITVKENEWDDVAEYLWSNRESFTGVSMIADTGDKDYAFAPNEAVVTPADEARWNEIVSKYKPVDYASIVEANDETNLSGEVACGGGSCIV